MKKIYKILFIVAVIFAAAILAYNIYNLFNPGITTQIAVKGSIEETVFTRGAVIREEEVVLKASDVIVSSVVRDGERVAKGQKLADLYYGVVTPELQQKLREVNDKLSGLETLKEGGGQHSVNSIDSMLKSYSADIISAAHKKNGVELNKIRGKIEDVMNRKILSDKENAIAVIDDLRKQQADLEAQVTGDKQEAFASSAGMYFSSFDGYEGKIGTENIDTITPSGLKTLFELKPEINSHDATMKVANGFDWHIAVSVEEEKLPTLQRKMQYGYEIKIRFPQFGQQSYPVQLIKISEPENGEVVAVLRCGSYCDAVYYNRFLEAELILNEYTGLKFFKDAVKVYNEKTGVFVRTNNGVAKFKEIEILANDEGYVVAKEDNNKQGGLLLYDEVVITRNSIQNGDVV